MGQESMLKRVAAELRRVVDVLEEMADAYSEARNGQIEKEVLWSRREKKGTRNSGEEDDNYKEGLKVRITRSDQYYGRTGRLVSKRG